MSKLSSPGALVTVSYSSISQTLAARTSKGNASQDGDPYKQSETEKPKERSLTRFELRRLIANRKATGNELTYDITDFSDILGLASQETKDMFNFEIKWDTSKAENMKDMFKGGTTFNNAGKPLVLNTDNVTDMSGMFYNNEQFNQPLIFSETIQVDDFSEMFFNCKDFNQDISDMETNINAMLDTRNSAFGANPNWLGEHRFWQIPLLKEDEILIHDAVLI